jgi:hypothetical protein
MVLDLVSHTDTLGTVGHPVDFLVLGFAVPHVKAFTAEELCLFATQVAMSALGNVVIVLLLLVR